MGRRSWRRCAGLGRQRSSQDGDDCPVVRFLLPIGEERRPTLCSRLTRPVVRDVAQLTKLATFTDHPNPAVTRILFTPNDMLARRCGRGHERVRPNCAEFCAAHKA